jgi:hypothetical protein
VGEKRGGRVSLELGGAARRAFFFRLRQAMAQDESRVTGRAALILSILRRRRGTHGTGSICHRGAVGFGAHPE